LWFPYFISSWVIDRWPMLQYPVTILKLPTLDRKSLVLPIRLLIVVAKLPWRIANASHATAGVSTGRKPRDERVDEI
jgi:hypothetical protein